MTINKKIVLLGQFGVGKTSLMRRFVLDTFSEEYRTTLGVQIKKKEIELPSGKSVSMIIWDLEGFSSISNTRSSYLIGSNAYIYVFDVTRSVTYTSLEEDISFLKEHFPEVLLRIVGNKSDLISTTDIETLLNRRKINYHGFVSAKNGDGVEELFLEIAEKLT